MAKDLQNTDHWSKMRMNAIKNSINSLQKGRVLNWQKHCKSEVERELESAAKGNRDLDRSFSKPPVQVYNFQDLITIELGGRVPGAGHAAKYSKKNGYHQMVDNSHQPKRTLYSKGTIISDRYTLITPPSYQLKQFVRSRCPVLQCPFKI